MTLTRTLFQSFAAIFRILNTRDLFQSATAIDQ